MHNLNLSKRDIAGKGVRTLRKQGFIPAVIYGHKFPSQNVMVGHSSFMKVFSKAGESSLIDVNIEDSGTQKVIIHGVGRNNVDNSIEHVDFYVVDMQEKIKTEVPLKLVGQSKAVEECGGILVQNFDHIEIECLPKDLIPEIEISMSSLNEIGDTIYGRDLNVDSSKIKIFLNPDDPIISITQPRSEEELKALDEAVEEKVEEVLVIKKTKEEQSEAEDANTTKDSEDS